MPKAENGVGGKNDAKETKAESTPSKIKSSAVHHNWLYGLLIIFAFLAVFGFGMAVANHHNQGPDKFMRPGLMRVRTGGRLGDGGPYVGGRIGGDGAGIVDGQARTTGVVTSVNGSSFTIAGHGSTTDVATNSSTQYHGGNQVKQNDTVLVFGTTSNGTITATQVVINP